MLSEIYCQSDNHQVFLSFIFVSLNFKIYLNRQLLVQRYQ